MLVTDDDRLYERIMILRDHGRQPGDTMFFNKEVAYKYKMSGLQAAFGLAQLERLDELVGKKREIFSWYQEGLKDIPGISLNPQPEGNYHAYWMSTVIAPGRAKEDIMRGLEKHRIYTRPFFHALSSLPAYLDAADARAAKARNTVSYALCPHGVNLPSALALTHEQVDFVCVQLRDIMQSPSYA